MDIRTAQENDVNAIYTVDHIAQVDERRRRFILESIHKGVAYLAVTNGQIIGYMVFEHSFFGRGFMAMLMVQPDYRHTGIGSALVRHAENLCKSDRIFTSTNESNLPMQALLDKLGYRRSGIIYDLDPGDLELIYSRQLKGVI